MFEKDFVHTFNHRKRNGDLHWKTIDLEKGHRAVNSDILEEVSIQFVSWIEKFTLTLSNKKFIGYTQQQFKFPYQCAWCLVRELETNWNTLSGFCWDWLKGVLKIACFGGSEVCTFYFLFRWRTNMHLWETTGIVKDLLWPCRVLQSAWFIFHTRCAVRQNSWLLKTLPSLHQGAVSGLWTVIPSHAKPIRQPDSRARIHS